MLTMQGHAKGWVMSAEFLQGHHHWHGAESCDNTTSGEEKQLTLNCSDKRSSKYLESQRWSPSSMPLQGPMV